MILTLVAIVGFIILYMWIAHIVSYKIHKKFLLNRIVWDLNICCGKTDVGKVNADIIKHKEIENFHLVKDIYHLPFRNGQFSNVLCSHTMEHVENPYRFLKELQRIGKKVTIIVPPLYDLSAAFNPIIHKWIFMTFKKTHVNKLPRYIKLPGADFLHKYIGQVKNA